MNVLVVAAHPDDEILGCGGTIAKHAMNGDVVHVVILAQGITSRYSENTDTYELNKQLIELKQSAQNANKIVGVNSVVFTNFPDNRMDSIDRLDVVKVVEDFISRFKPAIIYTHHVSDVNIDHNVVNQSVITACRPQPRNCVKRLLFFEVASSTEWQPAASGFYFKPNWFVDVSVTLNLKLKALNAYFSEIRAFPHSRSIEAIEHLARWRGCCVGVEAAEAFVLGRSLE